MRTALLAIGSIFIVLILAVIVAIANYISYSNYGNQAEQLIYATLNNNKNIHGQMVLKILETTAVSDKYTNAVAETVERALSARYGTEGSQAQWQWLQESNPQIDASVFTKIQSIIEAGRNEFAVNQTVLIDRCRVYETNLGNVWSGFWLRLTGYPKLDLKAACTPITSSQTQDAYNTGIDKPLL